MKILIDKIFTTSKFKNIETSIKDLNFYMKEKNECFLVSTYSEGEIKDFFDLSKTEEIIVFLKEKQKEIEEIKRNTSLLICLKVNDLKKSFDELRNQVFKIEEDEFFFKKYVLIYTENSLINLNISTDIVKKLQNKIKEEGEFEKFQNNNFSDEYFLITQLFIKLPFLKYQPEYKEYSSLENKINKSFKKNDLGAIDRVIEENYEELSDNIDDLKDAFFSEKDEEAISNFFEKFGDII